MWSLVVVVALVGVVGSFWLTAVLLTWFVSGEIAYWVAMLLVVFIVLTLLFKFTN